MSGLVPPLNQSGAAMVNDWLLPPAQTALSRCPAATLGQVKVSPRKVTAAPGVTPTPASAWAEKLEPDPSMSPAAVLASSVIPTLLNAAASDAAGTFMVDVVRRPSGRPLSSLHTACQIRSAEVGASAGTPTVKVCVADCPGPMSPSATGDGGVAR